MKKIIFFLMFLSVGLFGGCTDYNDAPAKSGHSSKGYQIPRGEIPSDAENSIVEAIIAEYNGATAN